jgi:hypothetical protein
LLGAPAGRLVRAPPARDGLPAGVLAAAPGLADELYALVG